MAASLLEKNTRNRTLSQAKVNEYAHDFQTGTWHYRVAGPICFFPDGTLANGQHRLWACVISNIPFKTYVVYDINEEEFAVIDIGKHRSMGFTLTQKGYKDGGVLAAAINVIWSYEHKALNDPTKSPSRNERIAIIEQRPEILDSVSPGRSANAALKIPGSVTIGLHYLFGLLNTPEDATEFWRVARDGDAAPKTGPSALHNYAFRVMGNRNVRPSQLEWAALSIKAFNYWMTGTTVNHLVWRRGGANAEPFPTIIEHGGVIGE